MVGADGYAADASAAVVRPRNCSSGAARWPAPERRDGRDGDRAEVRHQELRIGPEQPFCIIGERINPTGRKIFQEQLRAVTCPGGNDVAQQVAGGAMVWTSTWARRWPTRPR